MKIEEQVRGWVTVRVLELVKRQRQGRSMRQRRRGVVCQEGNFIIAKALLWSPDGGRDIGYYGWVRLGRRIGMKSVADDTAVAVLDGGYPEIGMENGETVIVCRASFGVLNVRGINEVCLLDEDFDVLAYARIAPLDILPGDTLQIQWEIRVDAGAGFFDEEETENNKRLIMRSEQIQGAENREQRTNYSEQ
jgi:hypothetical protein